MDEDQGVITCHYYMFLVGLDFASSHIFSQVVSSSGGMGPNLMMHQTPAKQKNKTKQTKNLKKQTTTKNPNLIATPSLLNISEYLS